MYHHVPPSQIGHLALQRLRHAPLAQAASRGGVGSSADLLALVQWVESEGGFLHPAIQPVQSSPCGGGRGLICTSDMTMEEVEGSPLILLPEVWRYGVISQCLPAGSHLAMLVHT